ncbi:MAG: LrgB family protein [Turicibacter sp.]|nr:LrgB family protein [Turicibacter sp.]
MGALLKSLQEPPLFDVMLSVGAFYLGQVLFKKTNGFCLFAPLFVGMVVGISVLLATGISFDDFNREVR